MKEQNNQEEASTGGTTLRRRKKPLVIAVTFVAIVVIAGVGFMVWHEQPSFCNTICHSPMDPYVQDYQDPGTDKLVGVHAQGGAACLDCHEATLTQQVSEGIKWVTNDYDNPLQSRSETIATREMCLKCHDDGDSSTGIDWDLIVDSTDDYGGDAGVNPHKSHLGDIACGSCHSMHSESTVHCNDCHYLSVPEGWS